MKKYILILLTLIGTLVGCNPNDALLSKDETGVTVFAYVSSFNKDGRLIKTTPTAIITNFDATKQSIEFNFEVADLEEGDYFKGFTSFDGKEFSQKMLLFGDMNQAVYNIKVNL